MGVVSLALVAGLALLGSVVAAPPMIDVEAPSAAEVEGPDFNVTAALEEFGVYVDEVPGLQDVQKRSLRNCQIAVS